MQTAQASGLPSTRWVPTAQVVHWWLLPLVQVRPAAQSLMALHGVQARSVLLVQAVLSYVPAAHVAAHVSQRLGGPMTKWVPVPHVLHC